ncbi:hypothetical protein [Tropicibacter naphthalenivorans]|uniref:Uncharacterized protein n=1 Tax=Tropicibacter naphthalenivorans TaxID=441103 RepID=A0A0P1GEQ2_9RHOB|nr:hypothetical protein [Tropicibacter naphthalenivorans]CUH80248.1 hypothetical protein TRN7648_02893 [Tropicibacter naphthalenivorans]SMC85654.1 hypothetical protein SAMN04488093_105162 [Tropicibacter naphthalenivorans]
MPRWVWFLPLGLLLLATAGLGFRYGWALMTLTETDVITAYAQRYLADRPGGGARLTDCVAYPGEAPGIWLRVVCAPPGDPAQSYEYQVNRLGHLVRALSPQTSGTLRGPSI